MKGKTNMQAYMAFTINISRHIYSSHKHILTEDHVGNLSPGVWVFDKIRQCEVVSCGAVKMKGPLFVEVAIHGAASWTTILWKKV